MLSRYKNLEIDIPETEFDEDQFANHTTLSSLRQLSSMKNLHDIRSQNQQMPGNLAIDLRIKLMNMRKLEKEKKELIKSYERLKKGAIQALVEKDDLIQSLKQKSQNYKLYGGQEQLKELQNELQKHLDHILELEEQRQELKTKIQNQRALFIDDIQNKSQMISMLWKQLQTVQQELENLEAKGSNFQLQLKMAEEQNQKLYKSLKQAQISIQLLKSSNNIQDPLEEPKHQMINGHGPTNSINLDYYEQAQEGDDNIEFIKAIQKKKFLLSPTSSASTKPHPLDHHWFKAKPHSRSQDQEENSLAEQLEAERHSHQQEIKQLERYYLEKYEALKYNFCKNHLQLQYEKSQQNKEEFIINRVIQSQQISSDDGSEKNFNLREEEQEQQLEPVSLNKLIKNCDQAANLTLGNLEKQIQPHSNFMHTDRTYQSKSSAQPIREMSLAVEQQETGEDNANITDKKWTKRVCFVLGVITGGSLMALVTRIIYSNH